MHKFNYKTVFIFCLIAALIICIMWAGMSSKENLENIKKKYAITFAGGGKNYTDALDRLTNEIKQTNTFDEVIGYTDADLKNDSEFWSKNGDFVSKNKRGYGYWIWKPFLILKTLNAMKDGDLLVYLDAGCEVVNNDQTSELLNNFFEQCDKYNILYTTTGETEKKWMKMDLYKRLEFTNDTAMNTTQHQATAIIVKKTELTVKFINEWYDIACDHHFIDDSPSISENDKTFSEHRHDQSIFSLLIKTEKYKDAFNNHENLINNGAINDSYPFLLSRKR
jgi:hypothetical protein